MELSGFTINVLSYQKSVNLFDKTPVIIKVIKWGIAEDFVLNPT